MVDAAGLKNAELAAGARDGRAERSVFDISMIMRMIPHRYPFLMIDSVEDVVSGERAVGIKNVTINEPYFVGHFPGEPIMPGVLIIEAMAQTAAALVVHTLDMVDQEKLVYFMTIDKAKFRRRVAPGDRLELHVRAIRRKRNVWRFDGAGRVGGETCAQAEFSAMVVNPPSLAAGVGDV